MTLVYNLGLHRGLFFANRGITRSQDGVVFGRDHKLTHDRTGDHKILCGQVLTQGQEPRAHILVQVTIYRRLLIGRNCHLDQSEAYDIS